MLLHSAFSSFRFCISLIVMNIEMKNIAIKNNNVEMEAIDNKTYAVIMKTLSKVIIKSVLIFLLPPQKSGGFVVT